MISTTVLKSWDEMYGHAKHGWLYRGQRSAAWKLQTSLERCCNTQGVVAASQDSVERELFREFRRAYHQYSNHVPNVDHVLEWLALMQHHGAPTRLLDFSYSIFVASYFALENAGDDSAVWALNGPWALQTSLNLLNSAGKPNLSELKKPFEEHHESLLNEVFFQAPYARATCPLNPFHLNERLRIQKGAFLVPADVNASFVDNLEAMPGYASNVTQIVIPLPLRAQALRQLFQMNVSRTTLFPGLDGFAQSLGIYHPVFDPVKWI